MLQMARYSTQYRGRFFKFCAVGLSGAFIQIGLTRLLFFLLTTYLHIDGGNANTIAVIFVIPVTTCWNFLWNALWVFKK
jgi:putative flippase GtrA